MTNQILVLEYLNVMNSITTEAYGPYDMLDIDHVAAEIIRMKFGAMCSEEELVELIDQFRCDGELSDENGEWFLKRTTLQKFPGFDE